MRISSEGKAQFFDANGDPLSGGLLFTYAAGTATKKDTYTSFINSVPGPANNNPIHLNSRGEAVIYLDGNYKFVLSPLGDTDPPTNSIWTQDNVVDSNINVVDTISDQEIGGLKTFTQIPILPAIDPTTDNQAVRLKYVQTNTVNAAYVLGLIEALGEGNIANIANYAADGGSTDAYAITLDPALPAYAAGQQINFKANTANTNVCTLNVNALGAKSIKKWVDGAAVTDLATGDIRAGDFVSVIYDGTQFNLIAPTRKVFRRTYTWTIHGEILDSGNPMGFYVILIPSGQTASLVSAVYKIDSGTSITVKLEKTPWGSTAADIPGFTGITVTTTAAEINPTNVVLADKDFIKLVASGAVGAPTDLTFAMIVEIRI